MVPSKKEVKNEFFRMGNVSDYYLLIGAYLFSDIDYLITVLGKLSLTILAF